MVSLQIGRRAALGLAGAAGLAAALPAQRADAAAQPPSKPTPQGKPKPEDGSFLHGVTMPTVDNVGPFTAGNPHLDVVTSAPNGSNSTADIWKPDPGTYQNLDIRMFVDVSHLDPGQITFIRCAFTGKPAGFKQNAMIECGDSNVHLEQCWISGWHPQTKLDTTRYWLNGLDGRFSARRCVIRDVVDFATPRGNGDSLLLDCVIADYSYRTDDADQANSDPPSESHNDGVQLKGPGNLVISGCGFFMRPSPRTSMPAKNQYANSHAVGLYPTNGSVKLRVEDSWFSGGDIQIQAAPKSYGGNEISLYNVNFTANSEQTSGGIAQVLRIWRDMCTWSGRETCRWSDSPNTPDFRRGTPCREEDVVVTSDEDILRCFTP